MVIDFHTHIFPDKIAKKTIDHLSKKGGIPPFSDGTLSGLMDTSNKIDLRVILPVLTIWFAPMWITRKSLTKYFIKTQKNYLIYSRWHYVLQ